ncbi:MAG: hypothetical protein WDM87_04240 [Terracidiphilus sp.]
MRNRGAEIVLECAPREASGQTVLQGYAFDVQLKRQRAGSANGFAIGAMRKPAAPFYMDGSECMGNRSHGMSHELYACLYAHEFPLQALFAPAARIAWKSGCGAKRAPATGDDLLNESGGAAAWRCPGHDAG